MPDREPHTPSLKALSDEVEHGELAHTLLIAGRLDIDIEQELRLKWLSRVRS